MNLTIFKEALKFETVEWGYFGHGATLDNETGKLSNVNRFLLHYKA